MKKFFDSRRDMVNSGPAFGVSGGGSGSGGGGSFIGRVFTVGRFQVTVEEVVAEGKLWNLTLKLFKHVIPTPHNIIRTKYNKDAQQ